MPPLNQLFSAGGTTNQLLAKPNPRLASSWSLPHTRSVTGYRRLCRLIDRDLRWRPYGNSGGFSFLPLILPLAPVTLIQPPYSTPETLLVALCAASGALWMAFVLWRAWRLIRAAGLHGDRNFDRRTRMMLGPEYRDTESATRARLRRRRRTAG